MGRGPGKREFPRCGSFETAGFQGVPSEIEGRRSIPLRDTQIHIARVLKLVDRGDLKSPVRKDVSVRFRPRAQKEKPPSVVFFYLLFASSFKVTSVLMSSILST